MPLARQSHTHDVAQALSGVNFPARKQQLIEYARSHNGTEQAMDALDHLPDEEYTSMADVFKGIGMEDNK
jgi:hypothetical protein